MRILDRYIGKSVAGIFVSLILTFCFLYILIDIAANLSEIINRDVPLPVLVEYYATFLPVILVQTSTVACLIAILLTFSNLNNTNEVVVLRSSGMSFWQICRFSLFFTLLIAAMIFWINERYVPGASVEAEDIRNENIILEADSIRKQTEKIRNLTFYGLRNRLYFINSFDPRTYELEGITIIGHDENQNIKEKIVALKGKWTGIAWKFFKCQISEFHPGNITTPESITFYEEKLMDIKETPKDFLRQRLQITSMNIKELSGYIGRFSGSGAERALNNLKVDLHQKIAFPFATIVVVLLGLPFALSSGRRKAMTFTSLGIAIIIGFLFYVTNAVGLALGKGGLFPPVLAAWLAPALFFSAAMYFIKTKF
jgi:lipopolysaccharide export system permease protein